VDYSRESYRVYLKQDMKDNTYKNIEKIVTEFWVKMVIYKLIHVTVNKKSQDNKGQSTFRVENKK
jgi:hypothetical protein